jgi:pyruvate,water dikinase
MGRYVLDFEEIDQTQGAIVGGKGRQPGRAFADRRHLRARRVLRDERMRSSGSWRHAPSLDDRLDQLSRLKPDDRQAIRALSAETRGAITAIAIPTDVAAAITNSLTRLGAQAGCAVRSSATAEDLPTASFAASAGHVSLNIVGTAAILEHSAGAGPRSSPSAP